MNNDKFSVGEICFETFPYQHWITFSDKTKKFMNGCDIVKLYQDHDMEIPWHFEYVQRMKRPKMED